MHLIAPQQIPVALAAGMTTLIGGGTGPAEGTKATTVTPGAFWLDAMLDALTAWPVNVVLLGKGNTVVARRCGSSCGPAPPGSSCTRTGARRLPPSTPA